MKLKELMETRPGTVLVLPKEEELDIFKVVNYEGATSGWINLVSMAGGREIVLEIEDRNVRDWREASELPLDAETMIPIKDIGVEVIIHGKRRFELYEGPSRAQTTSVTKDGTENGKLRFSVFKPEDDKKSKERVCLEDRGGRFVVYHSVGFIPVKEIQVK